MVLCKDVKAIQCEIAATEIHRRRWLWEVHSTKLTLQQELSHSVYDLRMDTNATHITLERV